MLYPQKLRRKKSMNFHTIILLTAALAAIHLGFADASGASGALADVVRIVVSTGLLASFAMPQTETATRSL